MLPEERKAGIVTARALIKAGRGTDETVKYLRSVYSLPEPCAEECVKAARKAK